MNSLANPAELPSLSSHLKIRTGEYVSAVAVALTLASSFTDTFSPCFTRMLENDSGNSVKKSASSETH
nr:hypothetical protein [bacterium]